MSTLRRFFKFLIICGIAAPVFYVGIYFYGSSSAAMNAFRNWADNSSQLKDVVGSGMEVKLDFLGGFYQVHKGDNATAKFMANLRGSKGEFKSNVFMEKRGKDDWRVMRVTLNGSKEISTHSKAR